MKRDFLDELEKQLVEAAESRRRKRLRFWPARLRPGRSVLIGFGGAALVMSSAALVLVIAGTEPGRGAATAGVRTATRGNMRADISQLAAAPSGHFVSDHRNLLAAKHGHPGSTHSTITVQGANAASASDVTLATHVATGSVPDKFQPESFTAVSELNWWLLGHSACGHRRCLSIVRTTNGGRSFARIPGPRTHDVAQLRFATDRVGYAFGRQLWSTHDGGQRWVRVRVGGRVSELSTAGGFVFAVVHREHSSWLTRSPIGLDDWQRMHVASGEPVAGLWTQADQVLVETESVNFIEHHGHAFRSHVRRLAISTDNGFRFASAVKLPRAGACEVNANLPAVWVHCASGRRSGTWRSRDSGMRFLAAGGRAHHRAVGVNATLKLSSRSTFAAASSRIAVVGARQLYRTTNGGHSYRPVATPRGIRRWQYLGFTDPSHGIALGMFGRGRAHERLYYTTNGGRSYHLVAIAG
jgi:hypothetical protein